jgi:hypothetical protein
VRGKYVLLLTIRDRRLVEVAEYATKEEAMEGVPLRDERQLDGS